MGSPAGTVLVVDDEESIRNYLSEVLSLEGYECKCFNESLAALAYLSEAKDPPDLVMTDIRMPGMDGLEFLKNVHSVTPGVPVVLISGIYDLGIALEAVRQGAADYLFKPAKPAEVLSIAAQHVRVHAKPEQAAVQAALTAFLAQSKAQTGDNGAAEFNAVVELFRSLGAKRQETLQHSMRVASYARLLGEALGLGDERLRHIQLGALLHDIGKIAIPRNVLLKPAALNEKEWEVMRTHPRIGYQLLKAVPDLQTAAEIVYAHHERFDGKGYPRGLRGEEIPLGARLFSIVDTVDAITSCRVYRPARGFDAAAQELRNGAGSQFDPRLVEVFLQLPQDGLAEIRERLRDCD